MEQRKPAKRSVTFRLSPAGYEHIKQRAAKADVDVSHMMRRMLTYASMHMPEGWVPPR